MHAIQVNDSLHDGFELSVNLLLLKLCFCFNSLNKNFQHIISYIILNHVYIEWLLHKQINYFNYQLLIALHTYIHTYMYIHLSRFYVPVDLRPKYS